MAANNIPLNQSISGSQATGRVVISGSAASNTYVVVGNNSVSNLAINSENVASAVISKVFWTGNTIITRNSVVVFSAPTGTAGTWDLNGNDVLLNDVNLATSNLLITTTGSYVVELKKKLVA